MSWFGRLNKGNVLVIVACIDLGSTYGYMWKSVLIPARKLPTACAARWTHMTATYFSLTDTPSIGGWCTADTELVHTAIQGLEGQCNWRFLNVYVGHPSMPREHPLPCGSWPRPNEYTGCTCTSLPPTGCGCGHIRCLCRMETSVESMWVYIPASYVEQYSNTFSCAEN